MKKNLSIVFALVLVLSLLTGCSNNKDVDNSSTPLPTATNGDEATPKPSAAEASEAPDDGDEATPIPNASEASAETTYPPASKELSAKWDSFQFELEGKIYSLPVRYSELVANGWAAGNDKDLDETLEAGKYILGYMTIVCSNKEKSEIGVQFANLDDKDMPLRDCYVSGIQLTVNSWNENTVLYFPGGFTIGSTKDEVKALYGEPKTTQEFSTTDEWGYETELYTSVLLTFTKETGKLEKMRMSNMYLP